MPKNCKNRIERLSAAWVLAYGAVPPRAGGTISREYRLNQTRPTSQLRRPSKARAAWKPDLWLLINSFESNENH